jgi:hypothetical protein
MQGATKYITQLNNNIGVKPKNGKNRKNITCESIEYRGAIALQALSRSQLTHMASDVCH